MSDVVFPCVWCYIIDMSTKIDELPREAVLLHKLTNGLTLTRSEIATISTFLLEPSKDPIQTELDDSQQLQITQEFGIPEYGFWNAREITPEVIMKVLREIVRYLEPSTLINRTILMQLLGKNIDRSLLNDSLRQLTTEGLIDWPSKFPQTFIVRGKI